MLAHTGDAPFTALARWVALPIIDLLLRNIQRGIGEIRRAVITHSAPAMIRMRMRQHQRVDRRRIYSRLAQAAQQLAAVRSVELLGPQTIVEQHAPTAGF